MTMITKNMRGKLLLLIAVTSLLVCAIVLRTGHIAVKRHTASKRPGIVKHSTKSLDETNAGQDLHAVPVRSVIIAHQTSFHICVPNDSSTHDALAITRLPARAPPLS